MLTRAPCQHFTGKFAGLWLECVDYLNLEVSYIELLEQKFSDLLVKSLIFYYINAILPDIVNISIRHGSKVLKTF